MNKPQAQTIEASSRQSRKSSRSANQTTTFIKKQKMSQERPKALAGDKEVMPEPSLQDSIYIEQNEMKSDKMKTSINEPR